VITYLVRAFSINCALSDISAAYTTKSRIPTFYSSPKHVMHQWRGCWQVRCGWIALNGDFISSKWVAVILNPGGFGNVGPRGSHSRGVPKTFSFSFFSLLKDKRHEYTLGFSFKQMDGLALKPISLAIVTCIGGLGRLLGCMW